MQASLRNPWKLFKRRTVAQALLLSVSCLALAVFAQRRLDHAVKGYLSFGLLTLAGVAFAVSFGSVALERLEVPGMDWLQRAALRYRGSLRVAGMALGIALLGCLDFWGNRLRPLGLLLWLGGLACCLLYLYVSEGHAQQRGKPLVITWNGVLVGLAVLVAAYLRLHQLDLVPADIGWDLPYNYADVASILRGEYRIFFQANMGREGLFFYWAALVARFSPLSHFSLKLASALVGILTVPALYLAARRLFGSWVALCAALLLATNRWHIVLSRAGFRVILLPLFVILLLYALARALASYRAFDFALAGLVFGLGLHTYLPFLFAPFAVVAGIALLALSGRRMHWRALWPLMALLLAVALVVYAPLGRVALESSRDYLQRASLQVRLLKGDANRTPIDAKLMLENLWTTLWMFNLYGDGNSRFNVPGWRHFGFVSGVLLVLGVCYALRRWRHGNNGLLLAMFWVFVLPSGLMALPHELPNIFRASGSIGPGLILAALPLAALGRALRDASVAWPEWDAAIRLRISSAEQSFESVLRIGRRGLLLAVPTIALVVLLVGEYRETHHFYFSDFVSVLPDQHNVSIAKEMARTMQAYDDLSLCHIKLWPYWFDGRALRTYLRREDAVWSEDPTLVPDQPPLSTIGERALFIVNPNDVEALALLKSAFPHSASVPHPFPDGGMAFVAVYIER